MNQNEMMMVAGGFLIGFAVGNWLAARQIGKAMEGFEESFNEAYGKATESGITTDNNKQPEPKPIVVDPNKVE